MRRLLQFMLVCAVALTGLLAVPVQSVQAAESVTQNQLVSELPAKWTPNVLNGEVDALAQVGDLIIVGGTFTQVQAYSGGPVLTRNSIFAFNKDTGAISTTFAPSMPGNVKGLAAGPDNTVYAGGSFSTVDGVNAKKIVRLNVSDGSIAAGWKPKAVSSIVQDVRYTAGRLFIAGQFLKVGQDARSRLAELNPTTGALMPFNVPVEGVHFGGKSQIYHMDINPQGTKLVLIGNFNSVGGQTRTELAMIDLTTNQVSDWQTNRLDARCYNSFNFNTRDVEFSPDGSYFVVGTTGGYGTGSPSLCDSISRWESNTSGSGQNPTWIDYTGGDSTYTVTPTGAAIYYGGHERWVNNPSRADAQGPGAVARAGIGALDPVNGLPLTWNPSRDRGQGVFDMLATDSGLFFGSDTDVVHNQHHAKLAFFPLAGGVAVPQPAQVTLPVNMYAAGNASSGVSSRLYNGSAFGASANVASGGIDWTGVRGAFYVNNTLYTAWNTGHLYARTFDGTTFGAATDINLNGLTNFANEMKNMTGLFYDNGKIYYTLSGQSTLYMRYFTVQSNTVGAGLKDLQPFQVTGNITGVNWSQVGGMTLVNGELYWTDRSTGNLHRVDWTNGLPVAGTDTVVSGPTTDSITWSQRALFAVHTEGDKPPVAAFTSSCSQLTCTFDGTGSSDANGPVTYAWSFGDGGTSTDAKPSHTFAGPGTYSVSLTVTDTSGQTNAVSHDVTPSNTAVSYVGSAVDNVPGSAKKQNVVVPGNVQAGDAMVLYYTSNSATVSLSAPAGWTLVGSTKSKASQTAIWARTATSSDAGSTVTVTMSAAAKGLAGITAYRGAAGVTAADVTIAAETVNRAAHTTPAATVAGSSTWLLSLWTDKTAATTTWSAPAGQSVRNLAAESAAGHPSLLAADSNGPVASGTEGGLTATANSASANATMATIQIRRAG